MTQTQLIMGMPIIVTVCDNAATDQTFTSVFDFFRAVDQRFSTYKKDSEISQINDGRLSLRQASAQMQHIFRLAEETKQATDGFFDIFLNGTYDPSGIVKGWAIHEAAQLLRTKKVKNFSVEAGGDIEVSGNNPEGKTWRIGIKNPFQQEEIVKVLYIRDKGVATSGTYIRGEHIFNPKTGKAANEIVSLTVIGPNIYEADRFATAAFAMGKKGIEFIEKTPELEGYMINHDGIATYTSGFAAYTEEI